MSGKLCKKCGCVLFDQNSDYCDSCKPNEENTDKKKLIVNNSASNQLSILNSLLIFVALVLLIVGLIMAMVGSNPTLFICGVVLFSSGVTTLLVRVLVNSRIIITKSAEYYNAQIEEKFKIE